MALPADALAYNMYVCQTKTRLIDRAMHLYKIMTATASYDPDSEVGAHFNSRNHRDLDNVEIHIFDLIHARKLAIKSKYLFMGYN